MIWPHKMDTLNNPDAPLQGQLPIGACKVREVKCLGLSVA
jgi:hypothetical protein